MISQEEKLKIEQQARKKSNEYKRLEVKHSTDLDCINECAESYYQGWKDCAEAEAERNSGLVECLREMENHPMTAHYVKTKITHTLNQYNKP